MFSFKYLDSVITLLVGLVITIFLAIFGGIKLKNKDYKTKNLPVLICWIILIVLEVMKIYYLIGKDQAFYPNRYPIVFCSIVMFLYPLFVFRPTKYSDVAMGFSVLPNLIAVIFVLLTVGNNQLVRTDGSFSIIHFHSIVYHLIMFGCALYLIIVRLYRFKMKDSISVSAILVGYVLMATALSVFIGGDISFFGPGFNSSPVLGFLYNKIGYAVGNLLLSVVLSLLCVVVYFFINLPIIIKSRRVLENVK